MPVVPMATADQIHYSPVPGGTMSVAYAPSPLATLQSGIGIDLLRFTCVCVYFFVFPPLAKCCSRWNVRKCDAATFITCDALSARQGCLCRTPTPHMMGVRARWGWRKTTRTPLLRYARNNMYTKAYMHAENHHVPAEPTPLVHGYRVGNTRHRSSTARPRARGMARIRTMASSNNSSMATVAAARSTWCSSPCLAS